MNQSTLIRKLTYDEISILTTELENNFEWLIPHGGITAIKPELDSKSKWWIDHGGNTALKDGKTIHLQWVKDTLSITFERWNVFPETKKIIDSFANSNNIGRVYWHRLLPGDTIKPHTDANVPFVKAGKLLHRYHIYLEVDPNIEVILDNKIVDTNWLSNSIIDFELRNLHSYNNKSQSTLFLLVFDIVGTP